MIAEAFVHCHRLLTKKLSAIVTIEGVGSGPVSGTRVCQLILQSRVSDFKMNIECLVVPAGTIKYSISAFIGEYSTRA